MSEVERTAESEADDERRKLSDPCVLTEDADKDDWWERVEAEYP